LTSLVDRNMGASDVPGIAGPRLSGLKAGQVVRGDGTAPAIAAGGSRLVTVGTEGLEPSLEAF
jgi:hypothetical protein